MLLGKGQKYPFLMDAIFLNHIYKSAGWQKKNKTLIYDQIKFQSSLTFWKMASEKLSNFKDLGVITKKCITKSQIRGIKNEPYKYYKVMQREFAKWLFERSNLHVSYIPLYRSCDAFFKFILPNFIRYISSSFYLNTLEFESLSSKHTRYNS